MENNGSDINDILYTSKSGEFLDSFDMSLLDDEEVPWDRIPKLREMLNESLDPKCVLQSLPAAKLLSAWGDEEGLKYLEKVVNFRIDKIGNLNPHRLRNYDITYEEILDAALNFWARYADRSEVDSEKARHRIEGLLKRIISLSSELPFEIRSLYDHLSQNFWAEYVEDLKVHLDQILDDPRQHVWKVVDCVGFLDKYNPKSVDDILRKHGKTRKDYPQR